MYDLWDELKLHNAYLFVIEKKKQFEIVTKQTNNA